MAEKPEKIRYSLSRALLNADTKSAPEFEIEPDKSWRIESGISEPGRSVHVPWDRLADTIEGKIRRIKEVETRDLTAGTQTAGAFTIGTDVIGGVRKSLRPTSLLMKLPITVLSGLKGSATLPRISTGITATSPITEIQSVVAADPAFGAAQGGPRRISAQINVSKQLIAQSADSVNAFLAKELTRAITQQIDNQIISGPQGLLVQANAATPLTSVNTYVAANAYTQLMSAQKQIEDGFVDAENAYWLFSTNAARVLRTTLKTASSPRYILDRDSRINNILAYSTSYIPASSDQTILADWTQLILGVWGTGIDITVDMFSRASLGEVVLTAQVYFNAWVIRPSVFVVSTNSGSIFTS